ncbi:hypothetical protein [Pseudobacteriovorax antillogorgiicola]|uniref:Uncharacterized protein n=1 Tax=Pseudobacteriovorax antillogorgiicola TaxID=1513793 RepID=A0A1Y6CLG7_9BACT|nr:hypothetical protein [Pseudobacteriovorax antillogorgiicola]TCS45891.1 hypothetical protein EDD56_12654 [Pseudobacteriovorax antillogorgiicola]SMF71169.1 hypothetical protein SAMN06296036_12644 [Pseudobacteriovorax antillogorgiicola]
MEKEQFSKILAKLEQLDESLNQVSRGMDDALQPEPEADWDAAKPEPLKDFLDRCFW